MFEEGEAQRTVVLGAEKRGTNVRFGSTGELAARVQQALMNVGLTVGGAGADGQFGFHSIDALRAFQLRHFGKGGADLVAGAMTAEKLGIDWP